MILYEGPSLLEPSTDIVCIAVPEDKPDSNNPKTGHMLFTHILRQDRPPEVAAYDGSDSAICGDCKFRAAQVPTFQMEPIPYPPGFRNAGEIPAQETRTCYVRLSPEEGADEAMPPSEVWRKWKAGESWPESGPWFNFKCGCDADHKTHLKVYDGNLPVRIGSYGNPSAAPFEVWEALISRVKHWTAYEHNWRNCDQRFKQIAMASVDTPEEREEAQALGWRTFMVVPEQTRPVVQLEEVSYHPGFRTTGVRQEQARPNDQDILCPATDPHPKRNATCATCLLCRGTSAPAPSIWEVVHSKNASNHKW